jgi:hypothetical protein
MKPDALVFSTLNKICTPVTFGRRCIEETFKERAYGQATFRDVPDLFAITGMVLPYTGSGDSMRYYPKNMCVWIKSGNTGLLAVGRKGVYEIATNDEYDDIKKSRTYTSHLVKKVTFRPDTKVLVFKGY